MCMRVTLRYMHCFCFYFWTPFVCTLDSFSDELPDRLKESIMVQIFRLLKECRTLLTVRMMQMFFIMRRESFYQKKKASICIFAPPRAWQQWNQSTSGKMVPSGASVMTSRAVCRTGWLLWAVWNRASVARKRREETRAAGRAHRTRLARLKLTINMELSAVGERVFAAESIIKRRIRRVRAACVTRTRYICVSCMHACMHACVRAGFVINAAAADSVKAK